MRTVEFARGGCRKFILGLPSMILAKVHGKDDRKERKDGKGRNGLGEGGGGEEA